MITKTHIHRTLHERRVHWMRRSPPLQEMKGIPMGLEEVKQELPYDLFDVSK